MAEVTVIASGGPMAGWLEVHVDQAHDKVAGQATVKLSEQPGVPVPMRLGDEVKILIDGRPVLTGYVHEFSGEHDDKHHTMTCVCRDQTQDLIDSTVGPKLKLKSPITLQQIGEQVTRTMGLNKIKVIDNIGPEPFREGEVVSAAIDDKGFHVLDQWAQKRQVLWNTDGKGNLVIDRNRRQRAPGAGLIKMFQDSPLNNVKRASFRNSDLERHNSVAVAGQKSSNDPDYWESRPKNERAGQSGPMQKNWGRAHDGEVRPERRLHARGAKGLSSGTPKKAAKWRSSAARRKGFQYTATVQGFYGAPGWLWWHGYLVPVIDEHFEIEGELLISDVRFKKTWQGGEWTELALTLPDAYTEDEGGSSSASRTSKFGAGSRSPGDFGEVSDEDLGTQAEEVIE